MDRTAALHALVERYYAYALTIARRLNRGGDWSPDEAHDALERLLREVRSVPATDAGQRKLVADFVRWAHVNAQEHRIAQQRDARKTVLAGALADDLRAATDEPTASDEDVLGALVAFRSSGVEDVLLAREEMAALAAALGRLAPHQRAALARTNKLTAPARARLAALLAAAGFPHTPSRGKALPRNRSAQMKAYRQALKERRMEAA